jgi:hypothetical protein
MDRPDINWAELAETAGIVTKYTATGGSSTNQGSEEARRALEWLLGDNNIRHGVQLWLEGRQGEQAAASAVWSVLMYIRSHKASKVAFEAYQAAKKEGNSDTAALAVLLISDICHPAALNWVEEFLAYGPTSNAGLRLVDQALFQGVIYPDDSRLERWLSTAESNPDEYMQEAAHRIRTSMAEWHP